MALVASDEFWADYKQRWGKKYDDKEDVIRRSFFNKTIDALNEYQKGVNHTHGNSDSDRSKILTFHTGDDEWKEYKAKFNKSYEDDEDAERRKIWEQEIERANAHNEKYKKYETYFNMNVDYFTDMPLRDPNLPTICPCPV